MTIDLRILVIDTATAACSVALLEGTAVAASRHEPVGRGHAERLLPMIADLPEGGRAGSILVDVGPGSFTGLRVGIAAARALGLGWGIPVAGYSSLALVAAAAFAREPALGEVAAVLAGGHGEVFMQAFAQTSDSPLRPLDALASLTPNAAVAALGGRPAVGDGVGWLTAVEPDLVATHALPDAGDVVLLPPDLRALPPRPLYGRAPDAKPPVPRGG